MWLIRTLPTYYELEELVKTFDIEVDVLIGHITFLEAVHYFAVEK